MIARRLLTVSDVAVAVALPLTRAELELAMAVEPPSRADFVNGLRRDFHGATGGWLWDFYQGQFAGKAVELLAQLERLGVRVHRRATPIEVVATLRTARLAVVIAHHPCRDFEAAEILDPAGMLAELATATDPPARILGARLALARTEPTAAAIAAQLNALLRESAPYYQVLGRHRARVSAAATADESFVYSRLWLERRLPTGLAAGPAIELWDGLHTMDEMVRWFPPDYDGAADLVVCNSVLHAEVLTRRFPDARFITSAALTPPLARLARLTAAMKVLAAVGPVDTLELYEATALASRTM